MAKIAAHAGADLRATAGFAPAIARVAAALVERWQNLSDGGVVEVKAEMSRVALEALVGCIFSERLGDPKAVCDATTRYYATCGGLDPFDVLGLPDFVPRFTRLGVRHVLRAFYEAAHKGGEFLISGIVFPARIVRVFNVAGGNHPFDLSRPAGLKVAGIEAEPLNKYRSIRAP